RLARMERKVFGTSSDQAALGDRTDKLEDYIEQTTHKPLFKPDPGTESAADDDDQAQADQSDYPRITALENAILGQTFPDEPPADRLSRMEAKAFGAPSSNPDLSERTDALEKYARKKLRKDVSLKGNSDGQAATDQRPGSQLPRQLLNIVGSSLLGIRGLGNIGMAAPGGQGQQAAMQESQEAGQSLKARQEDPLVRSPDPPPPGARLLTHVGWCEVRVFGRTFPEMHLPARLDQLNRELDFSPGKSGIQLMDDVATLIKVAQGRKPAAGSLGAVQQPLQ
ncbi:MAG TPA: hypothetical protein V6D08_04205, partial [Candidatus Obscuribacterales bacterium]